MLMKKIIAALLLVSCVGVAVVAQERGRGQAAAGPPKARAGHPSGKLILWGDVALFVGPGQPDNCIQTNRYKRGQRLGFRMAAIDGGTGEPENTATVSYTHLTLPTSDLV